MSPSKKEYIKSVKYLIKKGILEVDPEEPFDEYRSKLGFDSGLAIIVGKSDLQNQVDLKLRGQPDDSLDGLENFLAEDNQ